MNPGTKHTGYPHHRDHALPSRLLCSQDRLEIAILARIVHIHRHSPPSTVPPRSTPIAPFVGPILPQGTIALLYPQDDSVPRLVSFPARTLEAAAQCVPSLPYFDQNPVSCPFCSRPYQELSVGPISLLFTCLHLDDDADLVSVNTSLVKVFDRYDSAHRPPLGNVLAFKYERPPTAAPTKEDLFAIPFVPVLPSDVDAIDEMVIDTCFRILRQRGDWTLFVPFQEAQGLGNPDGSRIWPPFPSAEELAAVVRAEQSLNVHM
ncbi:hypothetical protein C8F01DRAFT_1257849 [Mycena amicta]|nr:hypothetical protein C8F01DRAFT_1257849 [Mycena amicta]